MWLVAVIGRGMSQADIQRALGTAPGVIGRWLYGERRPRVDQIDRIHEVFRIPHSVWSRKPERAFKVPAERAREARRPRKAA